MLPTTKNISKEREVCKTVEEFKGMVSGPDGSDVFVDGMHCQGQYPSEKTIRCMVYSGKRKQFAHNTNVYTNVYTNIDGAIIWILRRYAGSTNDITLFMENPMLFDKWVKFMSDNLAAEEDRIRVWVDRAARDPAEICPVRRR